MTLGLSRRCGKGRKLAIFGVTSSASAMAQRKRRKRWRMFAYGRESESELANPMLLSASSHLAVSDLT